MPWTTPATWTAGQVIGATDLNTQVRDNGNYLLVRPLKEIKRNNGADYTTTISSFADIDGTNLSATLTVASGRVRLKLMISTYADSAAGRIGAFDFTMDGTRQGSAFTRGLAQSYIDTNSRIITIECVITGVSNGSHTFKPQWASVGAAGTLHIYSDSTNGPVTFIAEEF